MNLYLRLIRDYMGETLWLLFLGSSCLSYVTFSPTLTEGWRNLDKAAGG